MNQFGCCKRVRRTMKNYAFRAWGMFGFGAMFVDRGGAVRQARVTLNESGTHCNDDDDGSFFRSLVLL